MKLQRSFFNPKCISVFFPLSLPTSLYIICYTRMLLYWSDNEIHLICRFYFMLCTRVCGLSVTTCLMQQMWNLDTWFDLKIACQSKYGLSVANSLKQYARGRIDIRKKSSSVYLSLFLKFCEIHSTHGYSTCIQKCLKRSYKFWDLASVFQVLETFM